MKTKAITIGKRMVDRERAINVLLLRLLMASRATWETRRAMGAGSNR